MSKEQSKKKKKKKSALRFYAANIILGFIILIILMFFAAYFLCSTKSIKVKGNKIYNEDEIKAFCYAGSESSNVIYDFFKFKVKPVSDVEFVDDISFKITGLHELTIVVKERNPYCFLMTDDGQYCYIDRDGVISDVTTWPLPDRVFWYGVTLSDPKAGKVVDVDDEVLKIYKALANSLAEHELKVDAIAIDENHNITMTCGTVNVSLGTKTDLDSKIKRLTFILPQVQNMSGTLHLENFSEENTDIVFKKE